MLRGLAGHQTSLVGFSFNVPRLAAAARASGARRQDAGVRQSVREVSHDADRTTGPDRRRQRGTCGGCQWDFTTVFLGALPMPTLSPKRKVRYTAADVAAIG